MTTPNSFHVPSCIKTFDTFSQNPIALKQQKQYQFNKIIAEKNKHQNETLKNEEIGTTQHKTSEQNQKTENTIHQTSDSKESTKCESLFPKSNKKKEEKLQSNIKNSNSNEQVEGTQRKSKPQPKSKSNEKCFSSSSESTLIHHDSQFFILKNGTTINDSVQSHAKKRGRTSALFFTNALNSTYNQQSKIPTLQEWFKKLSIEDRILSLTCIDKITVDSIIRMQKKIDKYGNGWFKQGQVIIKQQRLLPAKLGLDSSDQMCSIKNDHSFKNMKEILNQENQKDSFMLSSKQIQEKELLDNIRITETYEEKDTLTVTTSLVQDPVKFFELMRSIVGSNFSTLPYETIWDVQKNCFITTNPIWYQHKEYNSLAVWIIYNLERNMWIQFNQCVRGDFKGIKTRSNKQIFIESIGHLVDVRYEIQDTWKEFYMKANQDRNYFKKLNEEIMKRCYESKGLNNYKEYDFLISSDDKNENSHWDILLRNQEPEKFLQNLGMISLDRVSKYQNTDLEYIFIEIMRELKGKPKLLQQFLNQPHFNNNQQICGQQQNPLKKHQKKKLKQKLKKQQNKGQEQQENEELNQSSEPVFNENKVETLLSEPIQQQIKHEQINEFSVKEDQLQSQSDNEENSEQEMEIVDIEEEKKVNSIEFYSNQLYVETIMSNHTKYSQRNEEMYSELVNDLLDLQQPKEKIKTSLQLELPKAYYQDDFRMKHYDYDETFIKEQSEEKDDGQNEQDDYNKDKNSSDSTDDQNSEKQLNMMISAQQNIIEIVQEEQYNDDNDVENDNPNSSNEKIQTQEHFEKQSYSIKKSPYNQKYQKKENQKSDSSKNYMRNLEFRQKSQQQDLEEQKQFEQSQNNFVIIRSSQTFQQKPVSTHNNKNKKKKKRSKPVLQQNQNQYTEKSYLMNNFMKNIAYQDNVEEEGTMERKQIFLKSETVKERDFQSYQEQQIYVKKQKNTTLEQIPQIQSDNDEKSQDKQQKKYYEKKSLNNVSIGDDTQQKTELYNIKEKIQLRQLSSVKDNDINHSQNKGNIVQNNRFDQFLNQKEVDSQLSTKSNEAKAQGPYQEQATKPPKKYSKKHKNKKKTNQSPYLTKNHSMNQNMQAHMMNGAELQGYFPQQFDLQPELYQQFANLNMITDYTQQQQLQQLISGLLIQQQQQQYGTMYNQYGQVDQSLQYQQQQWNVNQMIQNNNDQLVEQYNDPAKYIEQQFFEKMEKQMNNFVKGLDQKLNSVRKERESIISIIQEIITKTYNNNDLRTQGGFYQSKQKRMSDYRYQQKSFVGIKMYGSMASGLAIDQSDVDIAVTGLSFNGNRDLHIQEMRQLYEQLIIIQSITEIKFIDSATIPVIKLTVNLQKISQNIMRNEKLKKNQYYNQSQCQISEDMRYLGLDITFEDQSAYDTKLISNDFTKANLGIECISYIQKLCMQFSDLQQIVKILKKLLSNKNLNSPYYGGLCSYSLVLMTSTFLHLQNCQQMAINLKEILNYYGNYFDPKRVSLDGTTFCPVFTIIQEPMIVNDPLNQANNTTRNAFRIDEILALFRKAHQFIMDKMDQFTQNGEESFDNNLLDGIIEELVELNQ